MWTFSDFQYGFRISQSTTDLPTVVSDRTSRTFIRSGATRAVALDISNTFNRVCHASLSNKLKSYGNQVRCLVLFPFTTVIENFKWFWMGSFHKNSG